MEKIVVRAVDSGNIQRSPTFQAIFNYFFNSQDSPYNMLFDSAGIDVDKIMKNETPALKKLSILDAGLYYDLIEGEEVGITEGLIDAWLHRTEEEIPNKEKAIITNIYASNKTKIHELQMKFRNEALIEAGIPKEYLPGMRNPYRNHKDLKLVLPVERKVAQKVEKYHQTSGEKTPTPRIVLYGDLVGTKSLPDTLKGGIETARKQVDYFMETKEKAMEKIIEILNTE
jgi:hypothetical protein